LFKELLQKYSWQFVTTKYFFVKEKLKSIKSFTTKAFKRLKKITTKHLLVANEEKIKKIFYKKFVF